MNQTIAQVRSAFALEKVESVPADVREKFKKLAAGLPAMILQNGFGHTLAFLLAKGKAEHKQAFTIMISWLKNRGLIQETNAAAAMKSLSAMPQSDYLQAQQEAIYLLEWIKRYANADLFSN